MDIEEIIDNDTSFNLNESAIEPEKFLKNFLQNMTAPEFNSSYFREKIKLLTDYKIILTHQKFSNTNETLTVLSIAIILKSISLFSTREVLGLIKKIFYIDVNKQNLENYLNHNKKNLLAIIQSQEEKINIYLDLLINYQIRDRSMFKLTCHFFEIYMEKILSNKVVCDSEEIKKIKNVLIILMFFPKFDFIGTSLEFIQNITEINFKNALTKIENKIEWNPLFFDLFRKEFLENLLKFSHEDFLYSKNSSLSNFIFPQNFYKNFVNKKLRDNFLYLRDCLILFFIFHYKTNFNLIREKYLSNNINKTSDLNILKPYEDFFKSITYFQENFLGNFFLNDMLIFLQTKKEGDINFHNTIVSKLENVLLNNLANINKFFNTETENNHFNSISGRNIGLELSKSFKYDYENLNYIGRDSFVMEVLKTFNFSEIRNNLYRRGNSVMTNSNYKTWERLFIKNPILTVNITTQLLINLNEASDSVLKIEFQFNYNDIFSAVNSLTESKFIDKEYIIYLFK